MATPRITQEAVNESADKLVAQGEYPSVQTVRDALGSGSYSTITKYLQVWRDQREKAAAVVDLPERVEAAYRKAAASAWSEATRLAGEQVAIVKDQMEQERVKHIREADEAVSEIERLEKLIQEAEVRVNQYSKELEELRSNERYLIDQAARAEAQRESVAKDVDRITLRVESLDKENRELIKRVGSLESENERLKNSD